MPSQITMPQLSDTMTEGTVVKWHKKEGDSVKAGEEIADVETDKATMPMEAFDSGTLAYIAAGEGQKVKVGGLLAVIATPGEDVQDVKRAAKSGAASAGESAVAAPPSVAQNHGVSPPDVEADHRKAEARRADVRRQETQPGAHPGEAAPPSPAAQPQRLRISPLAQRIAADKGVDVSALKGSGPGGRIVERDVLEAIATRGAGPAAAAGASEHRSVGVSESGSLTPTFRHPDTPTPAHPAPPPRGQKQVVPMSKMRSAIAAALLRSKQIIPHYYEVIDVDLEATLALREKLNGMLEKENIRLSIADFVMKAACVALLRNPAVNARFNPEKGEITRYGDVNLGIAVAIPDGLIVPVLRSADQLGLRELRVRSLDLIERARAQRLRREEQSEATFTVTSLGSYGIRQFSAIINPPEVAILAVGSAEKRPAIVNGQCVPRTMMSLVLSADHRVVDGAVAAEFLTSIKQALEEPGMMLL